MMRFFCFIICCLLLSCHSATNVSEQESNTEDVPGTPVATEIAAKETTGEDGPLQTDNKLLAKKMTALLKRAKEGGFSTSYALLADLGLHSGSKRLYFVNLSGKKVMEAALVTHGSSTTYLPNGQRMYSNVEGSLCSSLGVYKIGGAYQGTFGLAYKLYGLDTDNSNAYARAVVLHSHSCVPDEETAESICQSWGCPTISPAFLKTVASYIDASAKPMLLYMFDSSKK